MNAVDPTYPLYPVACVLSAFLLLLVLLTGFVRQSWNLAVGFLCFWTLITNLFNGINAVIWADNAEIKLYVYCDIVSRIQIVQYVVQPMATLLIIRRLSLIAKQRSVTFPSRSAKYRDAAIEWILGLAIPLLVAGPLYYIVQPVRFEVNEGFGCTNAPNGVILTDLIVLSWGLIPPLISICFYLPSVLRVFYYRSKDVNRFLRTNDSIPRTVYFRILALASIDIVLTLPLNVTSLILDITSGTSSFYDGWTAEHTDWDPVSYSYADLRALGNSAFVGTYFIPWTSTVLGLAIFALFGATKEARVSYIRIIYAIGGWIGWSSASRDTASGARSALATMEFASGARPQTTLDTEFSTGIRSDIPSSSTFTPEKDLQSQVNPESSTGHSKETPVDDHAVSVEKAHEGPCLDRTRSKELG